jgi:hypothetical protein
MKIVLRQICSGIHLKFRSLLLSGILLLISLNLTMTGCVQQFVPETNWTNGILVVEGLITDQPGQNFIKLSTSMPVGGRNSVNPFYGCIVTITDDAGNSYGFPGGAGGFYKPDPSFCGVIGRYYTLHINTGFDRNYVAYESSPMLLSAVPPIDSVYYEKVVLETSSDGFPVKEGATVYLNSHDPTGSCKYYRWEYEETWEFRLPYVVPNNICWITNSSDKINIRNITALSVNRLERIPVNYITNETDRLKVKYSILVNQYSMSEAEYSYWEKLKYVVEDVGSLYDIIPSTIPSNVKCLNKPDDIVLGYFSVSGVKSKRLFIKSQFRGLVNLYDDCDNGTISASVDLPNLNKTVWIIGYNGSDRILTFHKYCADCTTRGTTTEPSFWKDVK